MQGEFLRVLGGTVPLFGIICQAKSHPSGERLKNNKGKMGTGSIFSSSETKVKNGTCPHFSVRHLFVDKPAFVVDWLVIYLSHISDYTTF